MPKNPSKYSHFRTTFLSAALGVKIPVDIYFKVMLGLLKVILMFQRIHRHPREVAGEVAIQG